MSYCECQCGHLLSMLVWAHAVNVNGPFVVGVDVATCCARLGFHKYSHKYSLHPECRLCLLTIESLLVYHENEQLARCRMV